MSLKPCSRTKTRPVPTCHNQVCRLLPYNPSPHLFRFIPVPQTPSFLRLLLPSTTPTLDSHKVTNHPRPLRESRHPPRDSSHQGIPNQKPSASLLPPTRAHPTHRFFPMALVTMCFGPDGRGISRRQASSATCTSRWVASFVIPIERFYAASRRFSPSIPMQTDYFTYQLLFPGSIYHQTIPISPPHASYTQSVQLEVFIPWLYFRRHHQIRPCRQICPTVTALTTRLPSTALCRMTSSATVTDGRTMLILLLKGM